MYSSALLTRTLAFRHAASRVLADPRVAWGIAALLAIRLILVNVAASARPDGLNFLRGGADWLSHPGDLWAGIADYISRVHYQPPEAFLSPPTLATLAAPFSLLRPPLDLITWTLADCVALVAAFLILDRTLGLRGALRGWFWVVILIFPPILAETTASQIGGFLMLLVCGAIAVARRRPALAGALAGIGGALKLYPVSMIIGSGRQVVRFTVGAVCGAVMSLAVGFARPGIPGPVTYVREVLAPVVATPLVHNCAVISVPTLWARLFGGSYYFDQATGATQTIQLLSIQPLAEALTVLSLVSLIVVAVWAAWRSGWQPVYSLAMALALGAMLPADVFTYQVLPLLPAILVVLVSSVRTKSWATVSLLVVGMLGLVEQPCALLFPNVWTLAIVFLFAVCAARARHVVSWHERASQEPGRL